MVSAVFLIDIKCTGKGGTTHGARPAGRYRISCPRNLVEFVLRSGDIDNRRTAGAQREAMLAGGRMHRKIQRRMGSGYQAEVSLRHSVEEDGFQIVVEGRADGIIRDGKDVTIDEIKCVYQDVNCLEEAVGVHMAQARCYGYIYGLQEVLDEVTLQLTYCNLETEEIRRFQEIQTMDELSEWFAGLIHEYVKWARYLYHNGLRRDESIKALEFPYPYRAGQRDLAVAVYRTLERGRRLFVQAPTGIGKTLSTVFPALKAIGEGHGQKLFYLTAKTITRTVAEEALADFAGTRAVFSFGHDHGKGKVVYFGKTGVQSGNVPACERAF